MVYPAGGGGELAGFGVRKNILQRLIGKFLALLIDSGHLTGALPKAKQTILIFEYCSNCVRIMFRHMNVWNMWV